MQYYNTANFIHVNIICWCGCSKAACAFNSSSSSSSSSSPLQLRSSVLGPHPDFTSVPRPSVPALTGATVAQAVRCADEAVVFVTLPVITLAVLSRHPPVLWGADALTTMTGTFSVTHNSISSLTVLPALGVAHITGPGKLAHLPEPAVLADAASTGTVTMSSADFPANVLTLAVVTLAVLAVDAAVPRWVTGTLPTQALTSSEAGQIGRSATLPRAALQREGAGQRMLALLPGPALLAVTSATVTLAVTRAEVIRVAVVGCVAVPLVALTGVPVDVAPVAGRIHVVAVALSTYAGASVAADFAIWRRAPPPALPRADVTLEFTSVSMPTSSTVAVSTVTLAMASTHLSGFLIETLAVVALAVAPRHQAALVCVVAQAAATVAGPSVGAHHPLRVPAQLFALLLGKVALLLELADVSAPALVALAYPTVAVAAVIAGFPIKCGTHPVMALAARTVELSWLCGHAEADATFTPASPAADLPIRCPAAAQG